MHGTRYRTWALVECRVRLTPEAVRHARQVDRWWREHRTAAPDLFAHELLAIVDLIGSAPELGRPYKIVGIPGLRRILLPRTRYHAYYAYDAQSGQAILLAIWSAIRGEGPSLR